MTHHKATIDLLIEEKNLRERFILEAEEYLKKNPTCEKQAKKVINILQFQINDLEEAIILLKLDEEKND